MFFILNLLILLIDIYEFVIIVWVAVTWLVNFRVLDIANPQARNLVALLQRATDPVMKPVQKYVPPIGGIDLTPLIVIIGLEVLKRVFVYIFTGM